MTIINDTTKKNTEVASKITGDLSFDDKVIQKIVGISLENTKGLLAIDGGLIANIKNKLVNSDNPTEGVDVEVGKEEVAVDLNIVAEYGSDINKLYAEIKEIIAREVNKMTGLTVVEVNVRCSLSRNSISKPCAASRALRLTLASSPSASGLGRVVGSTLYSEYCAFSHRMAWA